jgi:multidrug efflux pump subunit AcrB
MWIVNLAFRSPYTVAVMALLIALLGIAAVLRTPTDVFPEINILVISVIWFCRGLPAQETEKRITMYRFSVPRTYALPRLTRTQ